MKMWVSIYPKIAGALHVKLKLERFSDNLNSNFIGKYIMYNSLSQSLELVAAALYPEVQIDFSQEGIEIYSETADIKKKFFLKGSVLYVTFSHLSVPSI